MAIKTRDTLKTYFETGDIPTQAQFYSFLESAKMLEPTLFRQNAGSGISITRSGTDLVVELTNEWLVHKGLTENSSKYCRMVLAATGSRQFTVPRFSQLVINRSDLESLGTSSEIPAGVITTESWVNGVNNDDKIVLVRYWDDEQDITGLFADANRRVNGAGSGGYVNKDILFMKNGGVFNPTTSSSGNLTISWTTGQVFLVHTPSEKFVYLIDKDAGGSIVLTSTNQACYIKISDIEAASNGGNIPVHYSSWATYADMNDPDNILIAHKNSSDNSFESAGGAFVDFCRQYLNGGGGSIPNDMTLFHSTNASYSYSYDNVAHELTITINGTVFYHKGENGGYCRMVESSNTFVIPRYGALTVSKAAIIATAQNDEVAASAYTTHSSILSQGLNTNSGELLLFSWWDTNGDPLKAAGLLADQLRAQTLQDLQGASNPSGNLVGVHQSINYANLQERFSGFISDWALREQDLDVLVLGDSILARTVHTSLYTLAEQQSRPPMGISKNIFSGICDKLIYEDMEFSRWDKSGIFTETGTGWTDYLGESLKSVWDDAGDRAGETRESLGTGAASVAWSFPADYQRSNFIYRTSSEGASLVTVAVSGGAGNVEVYNGSSWVEANGYTFSQNYTAVGTGYGNTEYGKRLKFRKVAASKGNAYTITVSKAAGASSSLMYWGIEQTKADYTISVRNASRGGHDISALTAYVRTEVEMEDTAFVFMEIPILNMKSASNLTPAELWTNATEGLNNFVFGAAVTSLETLSNSFADFNVIMCLTHEQRVNWVDGSGNWITRDINGSDYTTPDFFNQFVGRFIGNANVGLLNIFPLFDAECIRRYGNRNTALSSSGVTSQSSFMRDGTHQNDLGTEVMLEFINPLFEFTAV